MRPAIPRSFLLQASLALLPVILLAALGWHLVQRDRATVIEEARREAQRLAPQIARYVAEGLIRRMEDDLRGVRQRTNRVLPPETRLSQASTPAGQPELKRSFEVPMPQYRALLEAQPPGRYGPVFDGSLGVISVIDPNGRSVFPPAFPSLPAGSPTGTNTTALAAFEADLLALDSAGVRQRLDNFLSGEPTNVGAASARFVAALRLLALGDQAGARDLFEQVATNGGSAFSDGGLPLPVLAGYQLAELQRPTVTSDPPDEAALRKWLRAVERAATLAVQHPSAISVPLLEELKAMDHGRFPYALQREFERLLELWSTLESTLSFHLTLADHWPARAADDPVPAPRWLRWQERDWWVAFAPEHRTEATPPVTRLGVFPFSHLSFELAVLELFDESDVPLPDGLAVRFEVEGRTIGDTFDGAEVLASAAESFNTGGPHKYFGLDGWFAETPAGRLRASIVLAKPEVLLAMQRERSRWLFAIIGGSFLVSLIGMGAMFRSHRHQMELSLAKDNFVSSVSHELRAPIASVRLMAENLERGKVTGADKLQEYVRFIGQECRRLSALIENVLDFGRIEQGRKQYEFEPTDLGKLVEDTVRLMQPYAEERGVKLNADCGLSIAESPAAASEGRIHPPCSPPFVFGDKSLAVPVELNLDGRAIQQALINLIDNAIKHSPGGAEVSITLNGRARLLPNPNQNEAAESRLGGSLALPDAVTISVTDHGPGIPRDEHEKIFERFYRRGSELRRETPGIGIGLSIVKHIVEAHGGRVWVESEPGKGSRFIVELEADR